MSRYRKMNDNIEKVELRQSVLGMISSAQQIEPGIFRQYTRPTVKRPEKSGCEIAVFLIRKFFVTVNKFNLESNRHSLRWRVTNELQL
ncbi:hypothetical protein EFP53_09940 [Lacticaseibacillus paracasei]|nr:hypothetical protein [Lacticaseibacillus paracasei]